MITTTKKENEKYAVIDKIQKKLIGLYDTKQEAWTIWQNQWMGKEGFVIDNYSQGKFKNIKKYLK